MIDHDEVVTVLQSLERLTKQEMIQWPHDRRQGHVPLGRPRGQSSLVPRRDHADRR